MQTLILCLVLSYVAVALVKWTMARYMQSSSRYSTSAGTMEGSAEVGTYLSTMDPSASSMPCAGYRDEGSPNGFQVTLSCTKRGKANQYTFTLKSGGSIKNNGFSK